MSVARRLALGFVLAAATRAALAQSEAWQGHWAGQARLGKATQPLALDLAIAPGEIRGTLDLAERGVLGMPLRDVHLVGDVLRFGIGSARQGIEAQANLREGGASGTWTETGNEVKFELERKSPERPYREVEIQFPNSEVRLAGTLFAPPSSSPRPAAVIMHGSGDNERWHYRFLADLLARRGVAALAFDKRGNGGSTGNWREVGFEELARDGIAAVETLQSRPEIDPHRVGMIGVSQAGWIMPMAADLSPKVAFLIVISGGPIKVEEEGYYSTRMDLRLKGVAEADIEKAVHYERLNNEVTRSGQGYEELRAYYLQIREEPWFRHMGFAFPAGPKAKTRDWYRRVMDLDPVPIVRRLDIPVLWLFGEEDESFQAVECAELVQAIKDERGKDFTIHRFPGADHGLRLPGPAPLWRPFAPGYLEAIEVWLEGKVLKSRERP